MESVVSSECLVNIYQTIPCHIPCENLKPHKLLPRIDEVYSVRCHIIQRLFNDIYQLYSFHIINKKSTMNDKLEGSSLELF